MEEVSVGVIGCGGVAESCHLPAAKKISDLKIGALADINEEQARLLAEKFELEDVSIYTGYLDLLKDPDIDAVWIFTPPRLHAEMVVDSLKHGKHVLCEKPLASSFEEAKAVRKTLQRREHSSHPLVLMPAHNFIFTPCYNRAVQIVSDGEIGRIREIIGCAISNLSFYKARTDFRVQAKGGVIEDQLPHVLYLAQDAAGPCAKIFSVKPRSRGRTLTQDVNIDAELQGEVHADLSAAWSSFLPTLRFDLIGESGRVLMDILRTPYNVTVVKGNEKKTIRMGRRIRQYFDVLRGHHPSYLNEQKHFVELVNGVAEPRVTVENGLELVKTLEEVLGELDERPGLPAKESKVSIVRLEGDVEEAVRTSVRLLGGLKIRRGMRVVVKPNVCSKKNTEKMVITDPRVLESVLEMVKEKTENVLVVESDNNSGTADERVRKSGILEVTEECGAEFLNLSEAKFEEHRVSDLTVKVPKSVLEADYLINLPKMKTCNIENTFITIAMKNMFGVLADKRKVSFHKRIVDVLLYVNKIVPQDLIIVDGIVGMEGLGPVWGIPVPLNVIVSGLSSVTVDAVCCNIMRINPYSVEVLWRAYKSGLGEIDVSRVEVLGVEIGDVKRKFAHPVFLTKNIVGSVRTALKTYL